MDVVNVVVLHDIGEACLSRIAGVQSNVRVHDASAMFTNTCGEFVEQPDQPARARLDAMLAEGEVIFGIFPPEHVIARAPGLKWINAPSAGVDRFLIPDIIESPVMLTNSRGIHSVQMGETAFEMLLMLAKKAPFFFRMKEERKWQRVVPEILRWKTLAVLGLGVIGGKWRDWARLSACGCSPWRSGRGPGEHVDAISRRPGSKRCCRRATM